LCIGKIIIKKKIFDDNNNFKLVDKIKGIELKRIVHCLNSEIVVRNIVM
jgi:hypothetical protein